MSKRYCLALDLKDDPKLIAEYEKYHSREHHWPEITQTIKDSGITNMEIYRIENRLFMIMDVDETFDFAKKADMDANNPRVQEWEKLMQQFQQPLPWEGEEVKWVLMKKIFQFY